MQTPPTLVWFREDLRLSDNPALDHAVRQGGPVVLVFVLAEPASHRAFGGATKWWLHHSLQALAKAVEALGNRLILRHGNARTLIPQLARQVGAETIVWNRRYEADAVAVDADIKAALQADGLTAKSFNARLLAEPWNVKSKAGGPFKVYTPFRKALEAGLDLALPLSRPTRLPPPQTLPKSERLNDLNLLPTKPDWSTGLATTWTPGEAGAANRLTHFVERAIGGYGDDRDIPGIEGTSRLSPHLRFGEISPRQIWTVAQRALETAGDGNRPSTEKFLSEVIWREFSYHLLWSHPAIAHDNINARFDRFPWQNNADDALRRWQRGQTGYPIVDAAMRQLWQTGWMHNRLRMIVGSFLVKHLRIDWRLGEQWFWDTLVDADAASNPAGWQWITGCGADAAPYFRVFNPLIQATKFDSNGTFVRSFVPELAPLPDRFLHQPWAAPASVLADAGVWLDKTYPSPMVDHASARAAALAAFEQVKTDAPSPPPRSPQSDFFKDTP